MDRAIRQMLAAQQGGGGGGPLPDTPLPDTSEKIQISSLSLLKMLKHGKNLYCKILITRTNFIFIFRSSWYSHGSHGIDARAICR